MRGVRAHAREVPAESLRAIEVAERSVLDLTGVPATATAIATLFPQAIVDRDPAVVHDVAVLGWALTEHAAPATLLERARAGLKPGGRIVFQIVNRRSFRSVARLVAFGAAGPPGTMHGPAGPTTCAEARAALHVAGFVRVAWRASAGGEPPEMPALPATIAADGVSIVVRTPDEVRDLFADEYVIEAHRPVDGDGA